MNMTADHAKDGNDEGAKRDRAKVEAKGAVEWRGKAL